MTSLPTLHSVIYLFFCCFQPVMSDHGLLTTVAYKLGRDKPACYALEVPGLNVVFSVNYNV